MALASASTLSPYDRHDKRYHDDPAAYDQYYLSQIDELSGNYGDLTSLPVRREIRVGYPAYGADICQKAPATSLAKNPSAACT